MKRTVVGILSASFLMCLLAQTARATPILTASFDLFGTSGSNLYSVDETTGAASLIGPLVNVNFLTSLASIGTVAVVPEPSTLSLFATGLAGLGFMGWRRRRSVRVRAA